jgi:hypothetical protein
MLYLRTKLLDPESKPVNSNFIPPEKPKNLQRPPNSITLGTLLFAFMMVMAGVLIGGAAVFISSPVLFGIDATQAYFRTQNADLESRSQLLVATQIQLESQAAQNNLNATSQAVAFQSTLSEQEADLQQTNIAVQNANEQLQQTATQSALNVQATETASIAQSRQQRTQVALDYNATQAALNQNATQVELNFQSTRAALNGIPLVTMSAQTEPTPIRITSTPPTNNNALSLLTPLPLDTLAPTVSNALVFDFGRGVDLDSWLVSASDAWMPQGNREVVAMVDNAWLLSKPSTPETYALNLGFTPIATGNANYNLMLNISNGEGIHIRLVGEGNIITQVGVYRFNGGLPILTPGDVIIERTLNQRLTENSELRVVWTGNSLAIRLNDIEIMPTIPLVAPRIGAFGVQFPIGARISRMILQ